MFVIIFLICAEYQIKMTFHTISWVIELPGICGNPCGSPGNPAILGNPLLEFCPDCGSPGKLGNWKRFGRFERLGNCLPKSGNPGICGLAKLDNASLAPLKTFVGLNIFWTFWMFCTIVFMKFSGTPRRFPTALAACKRFCPKFWLVLSAILDIALLIASRTAPPELDAFWLALSWLELKLTDPLVPLLFVLVLTDPLALLLNPGRLRLKPLDKEDAKSNPLVEACIWKCC